MEYALATVTQVLIMFMLMAVGFFCYKKGVFSDEASRQLSNFLLTIVVPIIIICSYQTEFSMDKAIKLGITFILSLLIYAVGIPLSILVFKKSPNERYRILRIGMVYSNSAFMGIPLISALLGSDGVFYLSACLITFNIFCWSHCVYQTTGDKKTLSIINILRAPAVWGSFLGLILFFLPFRLPTPIFTALNHISSTNTPLAMILLGIFLAQADIKNALKDKSIYITCLFRLLIIPFIIMLVLKLIPAQYEELKTVVLISSCAPIATTVSLFARRFEKDYAYASNLVTISTLFSIITMPLMIVLSQYLW